MKKYILLLLFLGLLFWPVSSQDSKQEPLNLSVKTDFSTYEAQDPRIPLYTRLSPEPIYDLQPTESGKQIYPFIGQVKLGEYAVQYLYGIVDSDGCILADAIYADVSPMEDRGTGTVLPIWVLKKTEGYIPDDMSMWYVYGTDYYGFTAMDGSFVIPCIYSHLYCSDGRILAFRYDTSEPYCVIFDVYDLSGKLLLRSEDLAFSDRLKGYPDDYTYGQGLYSVAFESPIEDSQDNGVSNFYTDRLLYLMNEEGELVAGPFYDIVSLTGGPIAVRNSEGYYVYLDETYTPLPEIYHGCSPFQKGAAVVAVPWDTENDWGGSYYRLIDRDLQTLVETDSKIIPLPDGNFGTADFVILEERLNEDTYEVTADETFRVTIYAPNGKILQTVDFDYDSTWNFEFRTSTLLEFSSSEENVAIFESLRTGKIQSVSGWLSYESVIGDLTAPILKTDNYKKSDTAPAYLYFSEDLQPWKPDCTPFELSCIAQPGQRITKSYIKGLAIAENNSVNVYVNSHEVYASYPVSQFTYMEIYPNKVAAFCDEVYTCLYNSDGELFFSYCVAIMDD